MNTAARHALLFALLLVPAISIAQEKTSGSNLKTDILYRSEEGLDDYAKKQCRLDVHYPNKKGFPTVVWFHGGGLTAGDKAIPKYMRDQGYAVVSANYRHSPQVNAPVYIEDAAAAVAWTFANIESFGGDPDKIFVSGHSAGGYLTSMVTLDKRWLAAYKIDADRIAGAIPHSGHTITHFTVRKERGLDRLKVVVDDLAPLNHVRKDAPPLLLTTGDREMEMTGRYEENAYMWRMFKEAGHPDCTLRELEGFNHGNMVQPAALLMKTFVEQHSPGK
ncbi:alpha/beta hydrolase [Blastopirellula marina]|uniref:Lipase n=1 Tax=Blastopirellula marina TaxID=124 RepID=A0A2S8F6G1_9BACT|nr:alpha/beta hydrolase [Blastopirellula marina]PQO27728.1 lipase [Blastopirellula marina]PTL41467.1 alpha/beta hydrolase [Blastopirellula marina]